MISMIDVCSSSCWLDIDAVLRCFLIVLTSSLEERGRRREDEEVEGERGGEEDGEEEGVLRQRADPKSMRTTCFRSRERRRLSGLMSP